MVSQPRIIDLNKISDLRGSLSFAQFPGHIPFAPVRLFTLYDLMPGVRRGGHAHRQQHQLLIVMHGSMEAEVSDGKDRISFALDAPSCALYVPPLWWLEISFPTASVCAVLASGVYTEADYIRDYEEFVAVVMDGAST